MLLYTAIIAAALQPPPTPNLPIPHSPSHLLTAGLMLFIVNAVYCIEKWHQVGLKALFKREWQKRESATEMWLYCSAFLIISNNNYLKKKELGWFAEQIYGYTGDKKKEQEKEEVKWGRGNFRTGPQDTIDAVGDRMSQMLPSLYSNTQNWCHVYCVCMRQFCRHKEAYLLAWARNMRKNKKKKKQAWLKNCGCWWWAAGLKGHRPLL